ncbi:hypothetical protein NDU88_007073 [Pleurodeles waltl]|uniref:Uncharacterized protein n=1 Tax=Pleurodeles waltl TaxID=8319 RepID=A0AAV7N5Y9_PLEWA|nr:hypothetical protein NDU88_007073 [Pleurodeles waltl]
MHCSMFSARPRWDRPSTSTTSPVGLCSAPRSLLSSVTSSLWVSGLYQHCRRPAHSAVPSSILSCVLQRIFRQAGVRPPFNVLCKSPGGALRASLLVNQCYFLIVGVGPASTPPADSVFFRVLSARGRFYPMHCSVFSAKPVGGRPSTSSTSPLGPCSVPRSSFPSVTSSLWVPGLCQHRWRPAHSIAPSAHTGTLSDVL